MSTKTKRLSVRRDRRKAKASCWRRLGRSNPKIVGHGGGQSPTPIVLSHKERLRIASILDDWEDELNRQGFYLGINHGGQRARKK